MDGTAPEEAVVDAQAAAVLFGSLQQDPALEHRTLTAPWAAASKATGVYANAPTSTCRLDRAER
jgi:hypothetical protein